MPHPYIELNKNNWILILEKLCKTLGNLALIELGEEKCEEYVEQYTKTICNHQQALFQQVASELTQYINFYQVSPQGGVFDEFKDIYFIGITISALLHNLGHTDLNKLHLRAVLSLLDYKLHTGNINRPQLSNRIRAVIDHNTVIEHLGKYGWYLIYKCLYNQAVSSANPTTL